jgi:hypothetical protein
MSDQFNFAPPQMPQQGGSPNMNNYAGGSREAQGQWAKSVARSAKIKRATKSIIFSRSDFKLYLQKNGMDVFTSAVEFQKTGDFIQSSYIVYLNYNNYQEPLSQFLQRYPNLVIPVSKIKDQLKPVQQDMQVITPSLANPNPFEEFGNYHNNSFEQNLINNYNQQNSNNQNNIFPNQQNNNGYQNPYPQKPNF